MKRIRLIISGLVLALALTFASFPSTSVRADDSGDQGSGDAKKSSTTTQTPQEEAAIALLIWIIRILS